MSNAQFDARAQHAGRLQTQGMLASGKGDFEEATRFLQEALNEFKVLGIINNVAATLQLLGFVAQGQEDYVKAVQLYSQSIILHEGQGDKYGIALVLELLGGVAGANGLTKMALGFFMRASNSYNEMKTPHENHTQEFIQHIHETVDPRDFVAWMAEVMTDSSSNIKWIYELQRALTLTDDEKKKIREQKLEKMMSENADVVFSVYSTASNSQQASYARHLAELEKQALEQSLPEQANFISALRGLLLREDVNRKIVTLVEPMRRIARETQRKINEFEHNKK